jgi:hypothetical protein
MSDALDTTEATIHADSLARQLSPFCYTRNFHHAPNEVARYALDFMVG